MLVAISIPIFTSQLEKARQATTAANLRSAYAEASAALLTNDSGSITTGDDVTVATDGKTVTVKNVDLEADSVGDANLPFTVTGLTKSKNATITFTVTNGAIKSATATAGN